MICVGASRSVKRLLRQNRVLDDDDGECDESAKALDGAAAEMEQCKSLVFDRMDEALEYCVRTCDVLVKHVTFFHVCSGKCSSC